MEMATDCKLKKMTLSSCCGENCDGRKVSLHLQKSLFPTVLNATYTTRIITKNQDHDEIGFTWLNINRADHSVENKIMRNNAKEIQLI